jgi:hypothetical protein
MRGRSAITLKLCFVLLLAGATFLASGQKARAVSCSTKGCAPAYIQCLNYCKTLAPSAQAACRTNCQVEEADCYDICS